MEVLAAFELAMTLMARIQKALAERKKTIEINDLGDRFADVNDRIQAARGPQDAPEA